MVQKCLHHVVADQSLDVPQKLESLFVRHFVKRIVGIVAFEHGVDARICVVQSIALHVAPQRCVTELSLHKRKVDAIEHAADVTLDEDGETFVEPEVFPVLASDFISSPRVSNFVNRNVDLRLVSNNDSR